MVVWSPKQNKPAPDPIEQFKSWYEEAKTEANDHFDPTAMTIATATKDGAPSCRMMQLKGYDDKGFKFYGHYGSRWSQELMENPRASIQFYWEPLKRAVRIEGSVEKLSEKESDEYFHSRDKSSQISSLVSQQTKPISGKEILDEEFKKLETKYQDSEIHRPAQWGGYRVIPQSFEFWQHQEKRMHDRLKYHQPTDGEIADNSLTFAGPAGWLVQQLSP